MVRFVKVGYLHISSLRLQVGAGGHLATSHGVSIKENLSQVKTMQFSDRDFWR